MTCEINIHFPVFKSKISQISYSILWMKCYGSILAECRAVAVHHKTQPNWTFILDHIWTIILLIFILTAWLIWYLNDCWRAPLKSYFFSIIHLLRDATFAIIIETHVEIWVRLHKYEFCYDNQSNRLSQPKLKQMQI